MLEDNGGESDDLGGKFVNLVNGIKLDIATKKDGVTLVKEQLATKAMLVIESQGKMKVP